MPRILFTHHAVDRFIERWAPGTPIDEARAYLEERAASATRLRTKTALGQAQYELDDPRCVLVVKRRDSNDVLTCVTILPKQETFGAMTEIEEELIQEVMTRVPPPVLAPPIDPVAMMAKRAQALAPPKAAKVVTPPPPSKKTLKKAALKLQQAVSEKSRLTEIEKTRRHLDTNEITIARLKRAMRATVRYLVTRIYEGDERARAIAEAVQAEEPGYVTEGFLKSDAREIAS